MLLTLVATCVAMPIEVFYVPSTFAHPVVLINSAMENNLPNKLRNEFYRNPKIASDLAKESWFIDKEMQVHNYHKYVSIHGETVIGK